MHACHGFPSCRSWGSTLVRSSPFVRLNPPSRKSCRPSRMMVCYFVFLRTSASFSMPLRRHRHASARHQWTFLLHLSSSVSGPALICLHVASPLYHLLKLMMGSIRSGRWISSDPCISPRPNCLRRNLHCQKNKGSDTLRTSFTVSNVNEDENQ